MVPASKAGTTYINFTAIIWMMPKKHSSVLQLKALKSLPLTLTASEFCSVSCSFHVHFNTGRQAAETRANCKYLAGAACRPLCAPLWTGSPPRWLFGRRPCRACGVTFILGSLVGFVSIFPPFALPPLGAAAARRWRPLARDSV